MTLWSELFPDAPNLIGRKWFKAAGNFDFAAPVGSKFMRAHVLGAGGYGDQPGGGGAYARSRVQVTAGENFKIQVGAISTSSILGDSWVKRNDATTVIAYADRGRGSSAAGSVANSTGDTKRAGTAGGGVAPAGSPASDSAETDPLFGVGQAYNTANGGAAPGGGGLISYRVSEDATLVRVGVPGGLGLVCLEFFDANPGL